MIERIDRRRRRRDDVRFPVERVLVGGDEHEPIAVAVRDPMGLPFGGIVPQVPDWIGIGSESFPTL